MEYVLFYGSEISWVMNTGMKRKIALMEMDNLWTSISTVDGKDKEINHQMRVSETIISKTKCNELWW